MRISDWSSDVCASDLGSTDRSTVTTKPMWTSSTGVACEWMIWVYLSRSGCFSSMSLVRVIPSSSDISRRAAVAMVARRSIRSEEHTSELQYLMRISYAVFCLKKKKKTKQTRDIKIKIYKN